MYGLLTLSSLSALHAVIQTLPKYLQVQTNPEQIVVHRVKLFVVFSSLLASLMHFVIFKCNEEQTCMAGWLQQRSREYAYTTFGLIQPHSHHLHLGPGEIQFSSVQFSRSVMSDSLWPHAWIAACQASLSITNSQSLLKLMSIQSVMPSSHLILCCPLLLLPSTPPSLRVFSNESTLRMRRPKYWSFSFSISPSNEHLGLISFRMGWLDLLAVQGTLKSLLQHHSSKASILWRSAFFIVQFSHPYVTTGKTIGLTRQNFVGKVMSLLFNLLSRLWLFCAKNKRLSQLFCRWEALWKEIVSFQLHSQVLECQVDKCRLILMCVQGGLGRWEQTPHVSMVRGKARAEGLAQFSHSQDHLKLQHRK